MVKFQVVDCKHRGKKAKQLLICKREEIERYLSSTHDSLASHLLLLDQHNVPGADSPSAVVRVERRAELECGQLAISSKHTSKFNPAATQHCTHSPRKLIHFKPKPH